MYLTKKQIAEVGALVNSWPDWLHVQDYPGEGKVPPLTKLERLADDFMRNYGGIDCDTEGHYKAIVREYMTVNNIDTGDDALFVKTIMDSLRSKPWDSPIYQRKKRSQTT